LKKVQIKNKTREVKITQGVNFQPICREWQAEMCRIFGLQVEQPCEVEHGQLPTLIPDDTFICTHKMGGGGACLFCTWSFVITGVQVCCLSEDLLFSVYLDPDLTIWTIMTTACLVYYAEAFISHSISCIAIYEG
jgi:hypothetical protein